MSQPEQVTETAAQEGALPILESLWKMGVSAAPSIALFFVTLIVGYILSRILRRVTSSLVDKLGVEVWVERLGLSRILYAVGLRQGVAKLSGQVAYLLGLLLTFYVLLGNLGLPGLNNALSQALDFTPNIAAAVVLMIAGAVAGEALKGLIQGEDTKPSRALVAQGAYWMTLALVSTTALEQLGFEVALIHGLVQITFASLVFVGALVFAFSAKETFKHLLARNWAKKLIRKGDVLAFDGVEGRLESFDLLSVVLRNEDGEEFVVPYHTLMTSIFELREEAPAA